MKSGATYRTITLAAAILACMVSIPAAGQDQDGKASGQTGLERAKFAATLAWRGSADERAGGSAGWSMARVRPRGL